MIAPSACALCVCKTSFVVRSGGEMSLSDRCSHPENPQGFSSAAECQKAGRYRTQQDLERAKGVRR